MRGDIIKAVVLIDIPDKKIKDLVDIGIKERLKPVMYANVTLDYGDKVIYLDGIVKERELFIEKEKLKENISEYFANPYCAKTDIGNVMYEKEIMELIDRN